MADSGAIRAGRAFVELFADDSKLGRGLKKAEGTLKGWGSNVSSIGSKIFAAGLAGKGALSALTAIFEETGAGLAHMSERTGIGVENLSRLSYAASRTGVEIEAFEAGVRKSQKTLGAASIGNKQAAEEYEKIGLKIEDLINLSPEEQFLRTAQAISEIGNPAQRAAATMGIFGKQGTALLPLFAKGANGIRQLMAEADRLGITMSGSDAQAALELHEAMIKVWATLKGTALAIGGALAPNLADLADRAGEIIGRVVNWIKENRGLIVTVSTVATAVMAAGAAIVAIGYVLTAAGAIVGVLASVLGGVATVLGAVLSPIGLVAAGAAILAVKFGGLRDKVLGVVDRLSEAFGDMKEDFKFAFDAMKTALASGDFAAAAQVLWAFLKLEFARGAAFLEGRWAEFKSFLSEALDVDLFYGLKAAWIDVVAFMEKMWVELQRTMQSVGGGFQSWFARQWINIVAQVWGGKSAQEAQEVLKTFEEDQARRGGGVQSQKALDDKLADIEARRKQALAENEKDHGQASKDYKSTHKPEIDAAAKAKSAAEAEAEKALAEAKANLSTAVAAAAAAQSKVNPRVRHAGKQADDTQVQVSAGQESASGTFNAFSLGLLGSPVFGPLKQIAQNTLQTANNTKPRNGGIGP